MQGKGGRVDQVDCVKLFVLRGIWSEEVIKG